MTKRKILVIVLACILSLVMFISFAPKTYAYSEQNRIAEEVQEHIDNEELPSWHVMYKNYPYYQVIYQKFCGSAESLAYFAGISETHLREMFNWYIGDTTEWMEMLSKLHLDVTKIEPNSTLGIYFDGQFLNLIWTSEYIPNETLNLKSIHYKANGGLNGLWNHEMNHTCEHLTGDEIFELTEHLFIMESEQHVVCQINKTPVMAYHVCDDDEVICYGIGVEGLKNFTITGWEAELDHFQTHEDPDGYYTFSSVNEEVTFNLAEGIKYGGAPFYEFRTHMSVEITDCICQSVWDLNFGGYKHYVYFNTDVALDKIYRVDVAYSLVADDEIWAAKLLTGVKTQTLKKSLSEEKHRGGFLNLSRYQGLTVGDFSSNDNDAKHYRYRLMLNYDEANWDISEALVTSEGDYKRVDEFYALRLDFLYEGEQLSSNIKMDPIQGESMKVYNRDLVLNTDEALWKFKEAGFEAGDTVVDVVDTVGDVAVDVVDAGSNIIEGAGNVISGIADGVKDVTDGISNITSDSSKVKNAFLIVGGVAIGCILLYATFKIVRFIKVFLKKND